MQTSKKNNIIIILLLVLSVFLITTALFFSREQTMSYSFDVGKPWLYSRLEADFQFDIELDTRWTARRASSNWPCSTRP